MKKGDLVRLSPKKCFSKHNDGGLEYPASNSYHDDRGEFAAYRPTTREEREAWYDSPDSKGMTSGGDTKLPPTSTQVLLHRDGIYTVLRARCAPYMNYRKKPGMAQVLDTVTGENCFVRRDRLEVVSSQ